MHIQKVLGGCPCHPGYRSSTGGSHTLCDKRVDAGVANSWFTNCPNLDINSSTTFDIATPLPELGGENTPGGSTCPAHLHACSYLCFSHDSYGVAVVPRSLWHASQIAEASLWVLNGGSSSEFGRTDRAPEHWRSFDRMSCLPQGMDLVAQKLTLNFYSKTVTT